MRLGMSDTRMSALIIWEHKLTSQLHAATWLVAKTENVRISSVGEIVEQKQLSSTAGGSY